MTNQIFINLPRAIAALLDPDLTTLLGPVEKETKKNNLETSCCNATPLCSGKNIQIWFCCSKSNIARLKSWCNIWVSVLVMLNIIRVPLSLSLSLSLSLCCFFSLQIQSDKGREKRKTSTITGRRGGAGPIESRSRPAAVPHTRLPLPPPTRVRHSCTKFFKFTYAKVNAFVQVEHKTRPLGLSQKTCPLLCLRKYVNPRTQILNLS